MKTILNRYKKIEGHIWQLVLADFCVQLVNSAFFILLNYYMLNRGFQDFEIAHIVSARFLVVLLFAFPLGLFINGRKLRPFFVLGSCLAPLFSLLIIFAIQFKMQFALFALMAGWGASFTCLHVTILPYLLLNAKKETHSESIPILFMTWSLTIVIVGALNFFLNRYIGFFGDERNLLLLFSFLSFGAVFFVLKIRVKEKVSEKVSIVSRDNNYDWRLIFNVSAPALIIAIGAGFTIPFINLFFKKVHGVDSGFFSILASITYCLVVVGTFLIPAVKRRFGYNIAITLIQSLSVCCLFLLATTEWYAGASYAIYVAIFFYIIRQPFMNVAGPMTTELTMYYVGERNRELVSALNASIWSGSWYFSSKIFGYLREADVNYSTIFLITVGLYVVGVAWYHFLIQSYYKRKNASTKIELS